MEIPLLLLLAAVGLTFLAGFVKGVTGFALPMIMISGMASFLAPEVALAGLILPALFANYWQAGRQGLGPALSSARKHRGFIAVVLICLVISAQFVTHLPASTLFLILGIPVTLFAVLQLIGWRPTLDAEDHLVAEIGVGVFAGGIGGLSGVWGPPTVLYLTALNVPKVEHVRVQGVAYALGATALTLAHLRSGVLDANGLRFSALLVLPAMLGMAAGFAIQDRLDQEKFRWAILVVLVASGLNLTRRGVFG